MIHAIGEPIKYEKGKPRIYQSVCGLYIKRLAVMGNRHHSMDLITKSFLHWVYCPHCLNGERKMLSVKDHVKGKSKFQFYRKGEMYYKTIDTDLLFRVPCDPTSDASFNNEEKSMMLMKYISKEIKLQNEAKTEIETQYSTVVHN